MTSSIFVESIKSLTNHIDILNLKEGASLEVCEFTKNSFILRSNRPKISLSQLVSIDGCLMLSKGLVRFAFTGRVISMEETEENLFKTEIQLHQYDKDLWKKFLNAKEKEQDKVDTLFRVIKGS